MTPFCADSYNAGKCDASSCRYATMHVNVMMYSADDATMQANVKPYSADMLQCR